MATCSEKDEHTPSSGQKSKKKKISGETKDLPFHLSGISTRVVRHRFKIPDKTAGCVVRELEQELEKCFGEQTKLKPAIEVPMSELPRVCNPKELSEATKINLRSAAQTINSNTVELFQFDPNFFSRENIWCRTPGCKQKKPRSKGTKKEDLYLCPSHRKTLEEHLVKICKEKGVHDVSMICRDEDFEGYTSLIGTLESAFNSMSKPTTAYVWFKFGKKAGIGQELCLNMRNFLIIVNALLNPEPENFLVTMKEVMQVFLRSLKVLGNIGQGSVKRLKELVDILRTLIQDILFSFGVIYSWIYLSLMVNPGTQLGAGIGMIWGAIWGGSAFGVGGAIAGGLIGSGLYNLWYIPPAVTERNNERIRQYQQVSAAIQQGQPDQIPEILFYMNGSAMGDLCMQTLYAFYFTDDDDSESE